MYKGAMLSISCGPVPAHFVSGVESIRDLGVLIPGTLSWSDHIHHITTKACKMLGLICRSFSAQLPVSVKKSLYLSLKVSSNVHVLFCSVISRMITSSQRYS